MSLKTRKIAVWTVFLLALLVRTYHLNIPFVEPFNNISRQSVCASIARNFYEHGFNLFYPELDENGAGPSLFNAEMPMYSYLMAAGYYLAGGAHEWVARLVSVMFFMGMLLCLYLLFLKVAGERTAFFGLLLAAFSPMSVALSRSIQPDVPMLAGVVAALTLFRYYQETRRMRFYFFSAFCLTFAVATKIHALYAFIPIVFMAWEYQRTDLLKDVRNYCYALIVSSALLWYIYMWYLAKTSNHLAYDSFVYALRVRSFTDYLKLFLPPYIQLPIKATVVHLLTPLGALLCFFGLFQKPKHGQGVIRAWGLSVLFYLLVMWPTTVIHPYYFLSFLPVFSFFVALGLERLLANNRLGPLVKKKWVAFPIILIQLLSILYFYRLTYFVPSDRRNIVTSGQVVNSLIPKSSLVVASWGASSIQLYYCHRKGWAFDMGRPDGEDLIRALEVLRKQDAAYFMTSQIAELHKAPLFERYLRLRYPVMKETGEWILFDLKGAHA